MSKRIHNGLNKKEQKVLGCFVKVGRPHAMTLGELAEVCWPYLPAARANSWVRNSIRRPCILTLLEQTEPGTYQITDLGREMVKKASLLGAVVEVKAAKPAKKVKAAKKAKAAKPAPVVEAAKVEAVVATPAPAPVAPVAVVEPKVEPAPAVESKIAKMAEAAVAATPPAPVEEKKPAAMPALWVNTQQ